jgi:transposase
MRSFTFCGLVALGATSHRTFRPGKRSSTTSGAGVSKATGIDSSRLFVQQNASVWAEMLNPARRLWALKASRPSRSRLPSLDLMPTSMSRGANGNGTVDTLGLPLSVYVTPADVHDTLGARCLLAGLAPLVPRLKKIWADGAYRGQALADWCTAEGDWDLEVVERDPGVRGFSIQPRRWVVERTLGWLSRSRRLSKDYERKVQTSETGIGVAMIRLLVARLGRSTSSQRGSQKF